MTQRACACFPVFQEKNSSNFLAITVDVRLYHDLQNNGNTLFQKAQATNKQHLWQNAILMVVFLSTHQNWGQSWCDGIKGRQACGLHKADSVEVEGKKGVKGSDCCSPVHKEVQLSSTPRWEEPWAGHLGKWIPSGLVSSQLPRPWQLSSQPPKIL